MIPYFPDIKRIRLLPDGCWQSALPARLSGWHAGLDEDAKPLKSQEAHLSDPLVQAGYTVFKINHRAAPRFRYPVAVRDAQRALRYIRSHAALFKINAERIGAAGTSSGEHLSLLLGVLDDAGDPDSPSPTNRTSSKAQAVVAVALPTDITALASNWEGAWMYCLRSWVRLSFWMQASDSPSTMQSLYREASPTTHISPDDPPVLLIHGDKDIVVPYKQSEFFEAKLQKAGGTVNLIRIPGGSHALNELAPAAPDYVSAMVQWFDRYLR